MLSDAPGLRGIVFFFDHVATPEIKKHLQIDMPMVHQPSLSGALRPLSPQRSTKHANAVPSSPPAQHNPTTQLLATLMASAPSLPAQEDLQGLYCASQTLA
jgi:hypothetical protein